MIQMSQNHFLTIASIALLTCLGLPSQAAEKTPAVGKMAPDFELKSLGGESVQLSAEVAKGPVVLVVLRGYPGYQCPVCTAQFGDYVTKKEQFKAAGAQVLFVYPGPADRLVERAKDGNARRCRCMWHGRSQLRTESCGANADAAILRLRKFS